jgi:hypothetical protein
MKIRERLFNFIYKKERGGALLDLVLVLFLLIFFIVILSYFGITFSTILDDLKKFFGFMVG